MSANRQNFSPRAAQAVSEQVGHLWRIEYDPAGIAQPGEVVSASVTFDESWSPYAQAQLTCRLPGDATLAALDPRLGKRLRLSAGYTYPDAPTVVPDVWPLADLGITRRSVRRPQGDLILSAMGDEILTQEALFYPGMITTTVYTAAGAISNLLYGLTGRYPGVDPAVINVGRNSDGSAWAEADWLPEVGGSSTFWSIIETVADSYGLWAYDLTLDRDGEWPEGAGDSGWYITTRPMKAASSAAQLRTGPAGTLTSTEATTSREDGWANSVTLVHEWETAAGVRKRVSRRRSVASGPMSVAAIGYHAIRVDRTTPTTGDRASEAAASMVRRTITRGRSYTLTAPALYWLRPGDTATVQLPTGAQERHLIARVEFAYPAGLMTLTTRLPESVTIGGSD